MNERKYQVFISSTFSDLAEERRKILDVLLMADCIPAGMEAFTATDVEQFEVIKRVIDLCDYYVLIIGKRYGSIHPITNISYTEMEYNYAIEQGIPVLVFALDSSVAVPPEKMETDEEKVHKLEEFRTRAMTNRLASVWHTSDELTGKLAVSIMNAKSQIKRPGWQRAVDFDEVSLRREIMKLQESNQKLKEELQVANERITSLTEQNDVAFEDYEVKLDYQYYNHFGSKSNRIKGSKTAQLKTIFSVIATEMMDVMITEKAVASAIKRNIINLETSVYLDDDQIIKRILNQLRVAGLISSKWSSEKNVLFWGLTDKGRKMRDDIILARNK